MVETDILWGEPMFRLPRDYQLWRAGGPDAGSCAGPNGGESAAEEGAIRVAILLLPQASLANIFAVFEDLVATGYLPVSAQAVNRFAVSLLAETPDPFRSLCGIEILPQGRLCTSARYDVVILPTLFDDGCLTRADYGPLLSGHQIAWLRRQHAGGAVFSTMCSGAYALAETGLLDGHGAAMHPAYAPYFARRFPQVSVKTNQTMVVSGANREFVTGGHTLYSADVSLYVIARFLGTRTAYAYSQVYKKDVKEPLLDEDAPLTDDGPAEDLTIRLAQRFMVDHLGSPALVGAAAELAHLNERTFARRFERATGLTPRAFVLQQRLHRARELLTRSRMPIEDVAARVGYGDRASFAKTFKHHIGETPAAYRRRTQAPAQYGTVSG